MAIHRDYKKDGTHAYHITNDSDRDRFIHMLEEDGYLFFGVESPREWMKKSNNFYDISAVILYVHENIKEMSFDRIEFKPTLEGRGVKVESFEDFIKRRNILNNAKVRLLSFPDLPDI